jgi:hypothetical protein
MVSCKTNIRTTHLLNLTVMFFWLIALPLRYAGAQEHKPTSYLDFGAGFFQVKDGKNYGLVFNGGMLNTSYLLRGHHGNHLYDYRVDFGFGPSFAKEIAGINFKLNPVNIDYLFRLAGNSSFNLYFGPYLGLNYQFQLYPELHSGHLHWFTFYDLGPKFFLEADQWGQHFQVSFAVAIMGLVSRPVEMNEVYYYSLKLSDIIGKLHSNFNAGSVNVMNHIDFETEWKIPGSLKSSLAYRLEYLYYNPQASLDYLSHTISYRIKLGTKKSEP